MMYCKTVIIPVNMTREVKTMLVRICQLCCLGSETRHSASPERRKAMAVLAFTETKSGCRLFKIWTSSIHPVNTSKPMRVTSKEAPRDITTAIL